MASRNMEQIAERAISRIPTVYDMSYDEMRRLYEEFMGGQEFTALATAFNFGFVMGHRATKAGKFRERKS